MPKASIKRNINCSKKDLIDLVLNIEEYPKFIPYCLNAHIYKDESVGNFQYIEADLTICLLYTSPSPRDATLSRMPSSA